MRKTGDCTSFLNPPVDIPDVSFDQCTVKLSGVTTVTLRKLNDFRKEIQMAAESIFSESNEISDEPFSASRSGF